MLESVAQREAESSRLQVQSWQNRFAEINTQQSLRVSSLESMLQQVEERERVHWNNVERKVEDSLARLHDAQFDN